MKILFLSHHFAPEVNAPASRTWEHCREWVREGHSVTVLTCVPNHPHGQVFPGFRNRLYATARESGVRVVRLLTYITPNEGFLKRTLNYLFFMVACVIGAFFVGKADVVVSTSPNIFNGLAGFFVSRLKRTPWVLEIRDLWPDTVLVLGAIKNYRVIKALEGLERFIYCKSDQIVSVTDSFVSHIEVRGGFGKVSVVKNSVDLDLFHPASKDERFASQIGCGDQFTAAYVGTHGMCQGLNIVLDAAQRLKHREDIVFLMVGDGAEKFKLQSRKSELALSNVVMLEQQPKATMPKIWSVADVSLVLLRKSELFTKVIPSKIFESMAMAKPIILGVEGESLSIIRDADAGIGIEPENAEALAAAVCRLADDRALYQRLAANGRDYVATHFDRRKLAGDFLAVLERTVQGGHAVAGQRERELAEPPPA